MGVLDIWGKLVPALVTGNCYALGHTDVHSSYVIVEGMKTKGEAPSAFKEILTQLPYKPRVQRTDSAQEMVSKEMEELMQRLLIKHEVAIPYTPAQVGAMEAHWSMIGSGVREKLVWSGLPLMFWEQAMYATVYEWNRLPTSKRNITRYEALWGEKPSVAMVRRWGCICYVHLHHEGYRRREDKKLSARAVKSIFVGTRKTARDGCVTSQRKLQLMVARQASP